MRCLMVTMAALCLPSLGLPSLGLAQTIPTAAGASGSAAVARPPSASASPALLPQVNVVASTPLPGTGIDRDRVPAETNVLTAPDLARDGQPDALQALAEQVGGVNLDLSSGNPFQPALFYHGFEASPLQGSSEGLAVYLNGVRFNQAFGDTVNWDLIPDVAIDSLTLEGSNPVFGLNALGGSLAVQLRNGFTYHGGELDLSGGSFARGGGQFQYGQQAGAAAVYIAGTGLHEAGWRDEQSSDVTNIHADLGLRNEWAEVHLGLSGADTILNGPGTAPVELLAADRAAQFTGPNVVANRFVETTLSGDFDVSDATAVQANAYYDYFQQRVVNGNVSTIAPCDSGSGLLCEGGAEISTTRGGTPIGDFLDGGPYAELDRQTTNTNGYGASAQATNTADVLGLRNHLVAGASFDGAQSEFGATASLGGLTPLTRDFVGPGEVIDEPGANAPVRVAVSDAYYGVFASDTLELTRRLSVTLSGRFNDAEIDLADQGGGTLTGQHSYNRFNPAAGATYRIAGWLSAYAGYSEANRAPTPAELSCAGPADACSLANFFVGDPNLKQVVAHSWEAGLRGGAKPGGGSQLTYALGLFHTDLDDDIVFVNGALLNRAYFSNVGQTRRQGVDAGLQWRTARWSTYLQYTYIDATFETGFIESAGSNPVADANGNITVTTGNRLPGVPAQQLKLGAQYKLTDAWTVGATGIAESGAYLFGDAGNSNAKLPAFFVLNLDSAYQLTPHVQLFGLIQNAADARYYTFGTFSPTASVFLAQAPNATNPRSYAPAAPVGGFGGVKLTF